MNWSNVISEIITADSAPITQLQANVTNNEAKINSIKALQTDMTNLQTAVQGLGDYGSNVFDARAAAMSDSTSTWIPSADSGTPTGTYSVDVTALASQAKLEGGTGISAALSPTSTVTGVTLANMHTATAVTAGTFTVNGSQVTVALTDSLQDVFNAISTATGGTVTASYVPSSDEIKLVSSSGNVVLGAANDTSNFLTAAKLTNNGTTSVSSSTALGSVGTSSPIGSAGLATTLTGLTAGAGSFTVNGVAVNYNANTDTIQSIISDINSSSAGVTASYDSQADRMVLTNNVTGDIGLSVADTSGNLMAALGLTTKASLQRGTDSAFSVNGGPQRTSTSNSLTATDLGVSGLALTVDSTGTQSLQVSADTGSMQTAIQSFITAYNTLQSDISTDTTISSANGTVTTSILSGNYDVMDWGEGLKNLAFSTLSGVSGTIKNLESMGIGFTGTSAQLSITSSAALQSALQNNPQGVGEFFQSGTSGFTSAIGKFLNTAIADNTTLQDHLTSSDDTINNQISILQQKITLEQATLTAEFTAMETAIQQSQSEQATLLGNSSSSSSSSSSTSSGSTISSSAFSTPSTSTSSGTSTSA